MLTPDLMHDYQQRAIQHQCSHPDTMLWLSPGLGKTVVTLTSIAHLTGAKWLRGTLVVAPLRVCRLVWQKEAIKWAHTQGLTFSMVCGNPDQRIRALLRPADIYLTNYENLKWLAETLDTYFIKKNKPLPFDGLVWDEVSKMKESQSKRAKAFQHLVPCFKWRTGLTGTPACNGLKDLFGQFLVVDGGQRLGKHKTPFMNRYFTVIPNIHKIIPHADAESSIKSQIYDITLEMSAEEYLKMPDLVINDVMVELPPTIRIQYDKLEKEYFTQLDSGSDIEVFNAGSLTNKLLQFSNGAVYPIAGLPMWEVAHDAKLEALDDILEEMNGRQLLLSYAYRSDAERIMARYKSLRPINLTDCKSEQSLKAAMKRWADGDCLLMLGHPASMGHGIDGLQDAGETMVWFGLNWSLELYDQFNKRLHRQGQKKTVVCHRIMCEDTMDGAQADALNMKDGVQTSLRKAIKEYRDSKKV